MFQSLKNKFILRLIKIIEIQKEQSKKIEFQNFLNRSNINIPKEFLYTNFKIFKIINNEFGKLNIGLGVVFRENLKIMVAKSGELTIEKNVFFNNDCSINCLEKILIGENTIFGEGVKIYDHNHKIYKSDQLKVDRENFVNAAVIVGKNCWISSNVIILKGVTIGDNCIIGAGCIIHKSIPPNTIVKSNQNLILQSI